MEQEEKSDVKPAIASPQSIVASKQPETITLQHPHTKDTKVILVGSAELVPLMGQGYAQVKG